MIPIYSIYREDGLPLDSSVNFHTLLSSLSPNTYYVHSEGYLMSIHMNSDDAFDAVAKVDDALEMLSLFNPNVRFCTLLEDKNVEFRVMMNGSEVDFVEADIKEDSAEKTALLPKLFYFKTLKAMNHKRCNRAVIADSFILDGKDEPINFVYQYDTIVDREVHKFERVFYAACSEMYRFLHKEKFLQEIACEYEEEILPNGNTKVYFALDTEDLRSYDLEMLSSGVPLAELVTKYLTGHFPYPKSSMSDSVMFKHSMVARNRSESYLYNISTEIDSFNEFYSDDIRCKYVAAVRDYESGNVSGYIANIKSAVSFLFEGKGKGVIVDMSEKLIRDSLKNKNNKNISIPYDESDKKWAYLELDKKDVMTKYYRTLIALGDEAKKHSLTFLKNNKKITKEFTAKELKDMIKNSQVKYAKEQDEKRRKELEAKKAASVLPTISAISF